ncbi:MAG: hypothetical protein QOG10_988 [Kribbellaceae bacterium]|nr:hypothetical protein [Kribbellaceae bacterium]
MTEPPHPSDPPGHHRPQDTPGFPTYGRPEEPVQPPAQFVPPGPSYQGYPGGPQAFSPPPYGYGYPQGFGYPGIPQARTNGLAIAALVTGLAGIIVFGIAGPVAVGLGIAALVQIRRRHERGTAQAVVGLVLGSLQVILWAGMLAIGFATGWGGDPNGGYASPTSTPSFTMPTVYVDELAVGECFTDGNAEGEVVRMPCNEPHDGELVADVTLPGGPYPGDSKAAAAAEASCDAEFGKYVGIAPDKSELNMEYWYPDQDYWTHGDRLVVCAAYGPAGEQLQSMVKGTRR